MVRDGRARYPVGRWIATALVAVALTAAVRVLAALTGTAVVVPTTGSGGPQPLPLGTLVAVVAGTFAVAVVAVLVLDRVLPRRSRRVARLLGTAVLVASLVPVLAADLGTDARLTLVALHLVVAVAVLRGVVREG